MDHVQHARSLRDAGLFRDALAALEKADDQGRDKLAIQVLKAEVLERIGKPQEAQVLIRRLFATRALTWADRSVCDHVLARIAIDRSEFDSANTYLTRSISCAQRAGDFEKTCYSQLKLALQLADGAGTDAIGPLLSEARINAIKTGNPRALAAVHVYIAQIEALRSSLNTSQHHIKLAKQLLDTSPNAWLEAIAANLEMTLALMASEFESAKDLGRIGLEHAQRSGSAVEIAVNRSNAGYAFQMLGQFAEAEVCFEKAMKLCVHGSESFNGTVDSLARVRMAQNRFEECEALLDQIDPYALKVKKRATYVYRHIQFTRGELWVRKGNDEKALQHLDVALKMSREAGDHILTTRVMIERAKVFLRTHRLEAALSAIDELSTLIPQQPVDVYAQYQELLAAAAIASGNATIGAEHLERAKRIYTGLRNVEAITYVQATDTDQPSNLEESRGRADTMLQAVITILAYYRHPEIVALEILALLDATRRFDAIAAIVRDHKGKERILRQVGGAPASYNVRAQRKIRIGEIGGNEFHLALIPKNEVEALATLHAASALIAHSRELEVTRDERRERSTAWPVDTSALIEGERVLSGHMRELMTFAQRVARTNVNVLITGESGTGKEILARAIHEFSGRAQKPFVPLNCSAVPRDLLESQLFGHRRGAFTGAERDHLGLIRSASDGTLFLDEIGDLGLDLQPKLLRFLESGEIAPLGEPSPLTVNVRVVAATNANLEDSVRDGKFREDLYYRLNVVRLSVKPLRERRDEIPGMVNHFVASAAREHHKGHMQVSEDTMERLLLYRWPGNVRQLQNEVRRMVAMAEPNSTLEPSAISASILDAMPNLRHTGLNGREIAIPLQEKLLPTLSRIEYEMIKAALREHDGRLEPAAKSLGISRKGLYLKRQRLGL